MKILIVSDTHGADRNLQRAVKLEKPFDMLIHCGDVEGREYYVEALAECPCCLVAGNMDFLSDLPQSDVVQAGNRKIFVTHGHSYGVNTDYHEVMRAAAARSCQAVLVGHTHRPMITEEDGVLLVNPGSLCFPRQEGRRPSYAVLYAQDDELHVTIKFLK